MTTMAGPFFGIPQAAVRLGKLKNLSGVAAKLYLGLWHDSERFSTRELTRTVAQLQALVGGSPNSHAKARRELSQAGLVVAEAYGPEGFVFHLCNPETGKPWPFDPREPVPYERRKSLSAGGRKAPAKAKKPPKIDGAGTSFPFGSNNPICSSAALSRQPSPSLEWDKIGG